MHFSIEDDDLLGKYNTIWDDIKKEKKKFEKKKEFDSESVYNKFLKTKVKSHGNEVTDVYDKKFLRWILIILV